MKKYKSKPIEAIKWEGTNSKDIQKNIFCTEVDNKLVLEDGRVAEIGDYLVKYDEGIVLVDKYFERYFEETT